MHPLLLPGLLSEEECHRIVLEAEARGFAPATVRTSGGDRRITQVRNNDRVDFEDPVLLEVLWERVGRHLDDEPRGLDPHLRVYRYDEGQRFKAHKDGTVRVGILTSRLSFLVFLNDDFDGGQTRFGRRDPRLTIEPDAGTGLLFPHAVWHEGAEVTRGRKYLLRTDVLYGSG